jgi:hypothetical protein
LRAADARNFGPHPLIAGRWEYLGPGQDNCSERVALLGQVEHGLDTVPAPADERAETVRRYVAPELVAAVESGRVSVSAAANVATKPTEEKREIVARGERNS